MPKSMTHFVGDSCKNGHWLEHRAMHWTDEQYHEASACLVLYQCGFCKNKSWYGATIGLIGRKPWTYICLTCVGMRVLGEEFFQWIHGLQTIPATITPGATAWSVEMEEPMVRIESVVR